eukprot:324374_1
MLRRTLHINSCCFIKTNYLYNYPKRLISTTNEESLSSSSSFLSSLSSKLSLEIRQEDSNLEAMSANNGEYNSWFIERWLETPIECVQDGLEIIHFGLGIPWWSTIALTAIAVRMACFPLLIMNAKQIYSIMDSQPVIKLIQDEYKRKKKNNEFEGKMEEKRWFQQLYHKTTDITGYRLYKVFLYPAGLLLSLPPFIFAARAIARRQNHDLNEGGLLWFIDLTQPDIHTVLPFFAVGMTWCVFAFKAGRWLDGRYTGIYHKYISFCYFGISTIPLLMLALSVEAPAGIFCYWIPFSLFGLFCKLFLHNQKIRKKLNIPMPSIKPTEPIHKDLNKFYHQLLRKYKRIHTRPTLSPTKERKYIKSLKELPSITSEQLTKPQNPIVVLTKKLKDNISKTKKPLKKT